MFPSFITYIHLEQSESHSTDTDHPFGAHSGHECPSELKLESRTPFPVSRPCTTRTGFVEDTYLVYFTCFHATASSSDTEHRAGLGERHHSGTSRMLLVPEPTAQSALIEALVKTPVR